MGEGVATLREMNTFDQEDPCGPDRYAEDASWLRPQNPKTYRKTNGGIEAGLSFGGDFLRRSLSLRRLSRLLADRALVHLAG